MDIHIEDNEKLFTFLRDRGLGSEPVIIGIDGTTGVGKSRLAYCIGCKGGVPVINVDHYVEDISGSYKDAVAIKDLDRLTARYRNSNRTFVIEGVCLIEVLETLNIAPDILIYYKKYNKCSEWADEDICNCSVSEEAIRSLPPLQGAIARYHNNYRPIDKATCIVYRVEAG